MDAIEFAHGVNKAHEMVRVGEFPQHFDLQVLLGVRNFDSIVLGKPLQEPDALTEHAIPGLALLVFQWSIAERTPLLKKSCAAIGALKNRFESLFKAAAENHGRSRFLFPPAVQIPVPVATRTA